MLYLFHLQDFNLFFLLLLLLRFRHLDHFKLRIRSFLRSLILHYLVLGLWLDGFRWLHHFYFVYLAQILINMFRLLLSDFGLYLLWFRDYRLFFNWWLH
jgi:hypothetical protein